MDPDIELPEDETPGELIKGYFTLMRAFGFDLWVTAHFFLRDKHGVQWFAGRISELKRDDPKNWNPNHKFVPQDPGVILRDYVHEQDTPYSAVFGSDWKQQIAAKKILGTRNTWFHFGGDPTTADLTEAAKIVRGFVANAEMHIAPRIDKLVARLQALSAGNYRVDMAEPDIVSPTSKPDTEAQSIPVPSDLPRPSIGGTWLGPIPELRYRMTKAGDVVHPDTLTSVRGRIIANPGEKIRAWTAVAPRGRELWIDADGAVGGFIGASPRLLGYIGPDPEGDVARGFFLPHYYEVQEDSVIDIDTGNRLRSQVADSVASGTALRVTTYGDVLVIDDNGVQRVATVTRAEWFPGHLG